MKFTQRMDAVFEVSRWGGDEGGLDGRNGEGVIGGILGRRLWREAFAAGETDFGSDGIRAGVNEGGREVKLR